MSKSGIELIEQERKEQIKKHGKTVISDVRDNSKFQLSQAVEELVRAIPDKFPEDILPKGWNYDIWIKMLNKPYKERLIISGALIAAEIDRLNYLDSIEK